MREPTIAGDPNEGASVYPVCQNVLLAAPALGYGGVMTGWHHPVEAKLRDLLCVPEGTAIAATRTLGRPEGGHGPVRWRPMSELIYAEEWGVAPEWAIDPPGTRHTEAGPPRRHSDQSNLEAGRSKPTTEAR
jgi:hypothetical protein